jgi:Na+/H+ antiporter NhaA
VGKLVGILLGTGLAVRLGLGELAPGLTRLPLAGGAVLSWIGFTISLFIVDLAFSDDGQADQVVVLSEDSTQLVIRAGEVIRLTVDPCTRTTGSAPWR